MIKLCPMIINERIYMMSISDVLDKLLKFNNHTLIFFDTETTGFNPNRDFIQLTQIGYIIVNGNDMSIIKTGNLKIKLTDPAVRLQDPSSKEYAHWMKDKKKGDNKTPQDILNMTGYLKHSPAEMVSEKEAISEFVREVNSFPNQILIAHNAKFDMEFVNVRGSKYGIRLPKTKVIDTLRLSQYFLIPALSALKQSDILKQLLRIKEKSKDEKMNSSDRKKYVNDLNIKPESYFDESGKEMLKIFYGYPSSSLGKLTPALIGKIDDWHDALADVMSMIKLLNKIIEILEANRNLDIEKFKKLTIKKTYNLQNYFKNVN